MKKILTFVFMMILVFSLGACKNGNQKKDTESFIEIQAYNRGYGIDGLTAVANKYMEKHENVTIEIVGVVDPTLANDIYQGPSTITTDMYFYGGPNFFNLINTKNVTLEGVQYESYFEPLDDVANYVLEGENRTVKDKLLKEFEEFYNCKYDTMYDEDRFYCLPWIGGYSGIVYNSKMFDYYGWSVPVTTDEMYELGKTIIDTDAYSTNKNSVGKKIQIVPFGYSFDANYWESVYYHWWIQYDGPTAYNNFLKGLDQNGEYNEYFGATDGRRYMIETFDKLVGSFDGDSPREYVFSDPNLANRSFIDAQSTFLSAERARVNDNGATTYAMMPNGDWLENEMYANYADRINSGEIAFKMMKIPVVSAIINHKDCDTIADDQELSALIKAIDTGSTSLTGEGYDVSQKAYDKIKEARGVTLRSVNYSVYIPVFAKAKEEAKNFLKYFYTNEALTIFTQVTRGEDVPVDFDYQNVTGISDFNKSKFDIYDSTTAQIIQSDKYPTLYRGNLSPLPAYRPLISKFNVSSKKDYISPQTVYEGNVNELKRLYQQMLKDSGLL